MPKKKTPNNLEKVASAIAGAALNDSPLSETEAQLGIPPAPEPAKLELHDVVQVLDKASKKFAQLAIVHTINGVNAVCYQPRYREKPESFILKVSDLHRIGPAHLKFKAAL